MNCQSLFSGINKKNIINFSSDELPRLSHLPLTILEACKRSDPTSTQIASTKGYLYAYAHAIARSRSKNEYSVQEIRYNGRTYFKKFKWFVLLEIKVWQQND